MLSLTLIQKFAVMAIPVLLAITVHEVAHGWAAYKLGDKTALMLGRLTLNPFKHIDPLGTVIIPLILLWLGGIIFGWARPIPINPKNFKHPRRDTAIVSAAGPFSNFVMAFCWAAIMKLGLILMSYHFRFALPIMLMGETGVIINLVLMVLNLIPLPPLDGSRIVSAIIPNRWAYYYDRVERYGLIILLLLLVTGLLGRIIFPIVFLLQHLLALIFFL